MKLFRWLRRWFRKPEPTPPRLIVVRGVPQSGRPVRGNARLTGRVYLPKAK
jgi:hypothetical protein